MTENQDNTQAETFESWAEKQNLTAEELSSLKDYFSQKDFSSSSANEWLSSNREEKALTSLEQSLPTPTNKELESYDHEHSIDTLTEEQLTINNNTVEALSKKIEIDENSPEQYTQYSTDNFLTIPTKEEEQKKEEILSNLDSYDYYSLDSQGIIHRPQFRDEYVKQYQNHLKEGNKEEPAPSLAQAIKQNHKTEENSINNLTEEQLTTNNSTVEELSTLNHFALDENGQLLHPEFEEEYKQFAQMVVTDDKGKPLKEEEQNKYKETLNESAVLEASISTQVNGRGTPEEIKQQYTENLKNSFQKALISAGFATNTANKKLSAEETKEIFTQVATSNTPLKASATSIIGYAGLIHGEMNQLKDRLANKFKSHPSIQKISSKLNNFDEKMTKSAPKSWSTAKRYGKIIARALKNVAIYTAVGATAGPVGLAVLAGKSAYDSYKAISQKAKAENMSFKQYAQTHKAEVGLSFSIAGLSIMGASIGLGAGGEAAQQAISPYLANVTRTLAIAPKAFSALQHSGKHLWYKLTGNKELAQKEKELASRAWQNTAEATVGIIAGAAASNAIQTVNTTETHEKTPEPVKSSIQENTNTTEQTNTLEQTSTTEQTNTVEQTSTPEAPTPKLANETQLNRAFSANPVAINEIINDGKWHSSAELQQMFENNQLTNEQVQSIHQYAQQAFDTEGKIIDENLKQIYDTNYQPQINHSSEQNNSSQILDTDTFGVPLDPEIQQDLINKMENFRKMGETYIANGMGQHEHHEHRGWSTDIYTTENGKLIVSQDTGSHSDNAIHIERFDSNGNSLGSTLYNADGTTQHYGADGRPIEQQNPPKTTEQTTTSQQEAQTNTFGIPLDPEVQQRLSNQINEYKKIGETFIANGLGTHEHIEEKGMSVDIYQTPSGTIHISQDTGHNADNSFTVTRMDTNGNTVQSIHHNADGTIQHFDTNGNEIALQPKENTQNESSQNTNLKTEDKTNNTTELNTQQEEEKAIPVGFRVRVERIVDENGNVTIKTHKEGFIMAEAAVEDNKEPSVPNNEQTTQTTEQNISIPQTKENFANNYGTFSYETTPDGHISLHGKINNLNTQEIMPAIEKTSNGEYKCGDITKYSPEILSKISNMHLTKLMTEEIVAQHMVEKQAQSPLTSAEEKFLEKHSQNMQKWGLSSEKDANGNIVITQEKSLNGEKSQISLNLNPTKSNTPMMFPKSNERG